MHIVSYIKGVLKRKIITRKMSRKMLKKIRTTKKKEKNAINGWCGGNKKIKKIMNEQKPNAKTGRNFYSYAY